MTPHPYIGLGATAAFGPSDTVHGVIAHVTPMTVWMLLDEPRPSGQAHAVTDITLVRLDDPAEARRRLVGGADAQPAPKPRPPFDQPLYDALVRLMPAQLSVVALRVGLYDDPRRPSELAPRSEMVAYLMARAEREGLVEAIKNASGITVPPAPVVAP